MRFFISTFENKELLSYYEAYLNWRQKDKYEEIENIIHVLVREKELIPIQAHYDWREALKTAYKNYRAKKIAEHLPLAFEEYLLQQSLGLRTETDNQHISGYDSTRNHLKEAIMKGRELNGEPAGLNF